MADFNLFSVPDYYGGLLGEEGVQKLQRQALGTGLINAALGFIAQPRNQRYGSALPYLGKALAAGYESGQNVIAGGLRDYETKQKLEELARQKKARETFDVAAGKLYKNIPAQMETVTTPGGYAPAQTDIQAGQVSPNYGMAKLPDVTTQREVAPAQQVLNQEALQQMMLSGDPRAASYLSGLKTLKELTTPTKADLVKVGAEEGIYDPNKKEWVRTPTTKADKGTADYQNWTTYKQDQAALGQPALSFNDWMLQSKKAGATNISVSTKGEGKFQETLGTELAKKTVSVIDAGQAAPEQIASARRIKSVLQGKTFTGAGAEQLLGINNALAAAGVIDTTTGINTEMLMADMAKTTLQNIKSSGLGAGQGFSNADRDFLEKASAGKITLNAGTIKYIADLNERAGLKAIDKYNTTIKSLPQENRQYYNLQEIGTEQYRPKGRLR
jgi:hypothetical protein